MLKKLSFLACLGFLLVTSTAFAQITVVNQVTTATATGNMPIMEAVTTVPMFDAGTDTKLVVGFGVEVGNQADFGVTFGGVPLTEVQTSSDFSGSEFSSIFFLDGATGEGEIVVTTGSGATTGNGPGIYAVALSGAELGFETSGALGDGEAVNGNLTGTLTGISENAYIMSVFTDQNQAGDQTVQGLMQVSVFSGLNGDQIGSAVSIVASGFGTGSDILLTFNDLGVNNSNADFNDRSNAVYASFAEASSSETLIGDVNTDGVVNFLDIAPFIGVLSTPGSFQAEADINEDGVVSFLDIASFIGVLAGSGSGS